MAMRKVEQTDRQQPPPDKMELMDNEIGRRLTDKFMSMPDFHNVYPQLHNSQGDPSGPAGMLAAQVVLNTRQTAIRNGIKLSDRIWAADGGVLDKVIDNITNSVPYLDPETLKAHAVQIMKMYDGAGQDAKKQGSPQQQQQQAQPAQTPPTPKLRGGFGGAGEGGLW